jgi:heme oxygenase
MVQLIDELISKLDDIKDAFLIGLLDAKKSECEDLKINIDAQDLHSLTLWSRQEIKKTIPISYKVAKIDDIFKRTFECEKCPLSITSEYMWHGKVNSYQTDDKNSEVCRSCFKKCERLEDYKEEMKKEYEERIEKIVANEEIVQVVRMKSIIRNINRKLKKL